MDKWQEHQFNGKKDNDKFQRGLKNANTHTHPILFLSLCLTIFSLNLQFRFTKKLRFLYQALEC